MPFTAKTRPPSPAHCAPRHPKLSQAAQDGCTIFTCLPGYLDTECLSAILLEQGRRVLWLRLEAEDGDPATFILSVLQAAQDRTPGLGSDLLDHMRHSPGPVTGWSPLFRHLAETLTQSLGESGALILEHLHKPNPAQPVLGLTRNHLIPYLPADNVCILISHERLPSSALPGQASWCSDRDLQLALQAGIGLAQDIGLCLQDKVIQQALRLLDGRVGAVKALFAACEMFGGDFLQYAVQKGHNANHLLGILLNRWLATLGDEDLQDLALCSQIEYTHPDLFRQQPGDNPIRCPWLQPLSDGWRRLRCLWAAPLRAALRNRASIEPQKIQQLALRLDEIGAPEQSIRLSCGLSDYRAAACVIADHAGRWMDLGQWELLEKYLDTLPANLLNEHPKLLFLQGELLAWHGQDAQAIQIFRKTFRSALRHRDSSGECQSLLAESVLSARQADQDRAQRCAQSALEVARQSGLSKLLGWAEWQLAALAISVDQLSEASALLSQSIEHGTEPLNSLVHTRVMELIQQKIQAQEQIQSHYEAYLSAERSSQEASRQLSQFFCAPLQELPSGLSAMGWNDLPVIVKLASPISRPEETGEYLPASWRERLQGYFSRHLLKRINNGTPQTGSSGERNLPLQFPLATFEIVPLPQIPPADPPSGVPVQQTSPEASTPALAQAKRRVRQSPGAIPHHEDRAQPSLAIFCLGPLRVFQKDKEIVEWTSLKGRDIFKYLAARPETPVPKDILIDVFWPDADPKAARRNLHQAIYSLRQTMRGEQPEFHHIWFENECYFLNPQMDVWLDYKEFEACVAAGRRLEKAGESDSAMEQYGTAVELYQGDFLEDDLYEDWPVIQRQNLLNQFLSTADQLAEFYFQKGQFAAAVPLCQKILSKDRTDEIAHRQLMQCYLAQGLRHLAVRQYQTCVRALSEELEIQPSEQTTDLYSRALSHPAT